MFKTELLHVSNIKNTNMELEYFSELLKKYQKKPEVCAYCGKPIIFKDFVRQYDQDRKYCSKNCYTLSKKEFKQVKSGFGSITEEVIYNFLVQNYPDQKIRHNVTDIINPYELDFVIDKYKLVIEFNGRLHYVNKYGDKRGRRTKLNDTKKKKMLLMQGYCVCRLWSEIGLYTRPDLFQKALFTLKEQIDKCLKNPQRCGQAIDILVSIDENINIIKDSVKST
jgi:very-short-patch-repair endonuclease